MPSLSGSERARSRAFRSHQARLQFIAGRYLARNSLSLYRAVDPQVWRFKTNAYGRPEVDWPGSCRLSFSISHTNGLAAVAVGRCAEIGLDVEQVDRRVDFAGVAASVFTQREVDHVFDGAQEQVCKRFFDLWTLKEAYIKARGMGFSLPPASFELARVENRITLDRAPNCDLAHRRWQFHLSTPRPGIRMAIAVGTRSVSRIRVFEWCPNRHDGRRLERAV